jgi:hypothetical protein
MSLPMVKDIPPEANHPFAVELRAQIYRWNFRLVQGDEEPNPAGQAAALFLTAVPDDPTRR